MAQHNLYATQVGPAFEQVRSKAVTQDVGRKSMKNTGFSAISGQEFPKSLAREATASGSHKKVPAGTAFQQRPTPGLKVSGHCLDRVPTGRYQTLFVSLARGADKGHIQIAVAEPEMAQFGHPQAGGVEQLQHGPISQAGRTGGVGGLNDFLNVL
jgi:hypothetical protein